MAEMVQALLGAQFWQVMLVVGAPIFVLGVTKEGAKVFGVALPKTTPGGKILCMVVGVSLIVVSIISYAGGASIGLINLGVGTTASTVPPDPVRSGGVLPAFVGAAHAQAPEQRLKVNQRSIARTPLTSGDQPVFFYVGDVHYSKPNQLLAFAGQDALARVTAASRGGPGAVRTALGPGGPLAEGRLAKGDSLTLTADGGRYRIVVENVIWFVIGDDQLVLRISRM